ncbi:hypothetical protein M011DRAFT_530396 [Sporormia fimetaria CBS 119925]|uniref:Uncharacterized protein n=1 Tax=Sporormia fimetaria CBS 119925 TaxID=1340428 RepID=A0A6A6UXB8_9PLEO|nr:hypothetical protein M011DRAFT_530396 [Sporormia fimetaria CBS 119925]
MIHQLYNQGTTKSTMDQRHVADGLAWDGFKRFQDLHRGGGAPPMIDHGRAKDEISQFTTAEVNEYLNRHDEYTKVKDNVAHLARDNALRMYDEYYSNRGARQYSVFDFMSPFERTY